MTKKTSEIINEIQNTLSVELPKVYMKYLLESEGEQEYLYSITDILERNITDQVTTYAPGYIIIGSDGGDKRYLMKSGINETAIYISDVGDMNPMNFFVLNIDCNNCRKNSFENKNIIEQLKKCDIILTCYPEGGLHDLLLLKNRLKLSFSAAQLLSYARNSPAVIIHNINIGLAHRRLSNAKELSKYLELRFL